MTKHQWGNQFRIYDIERIDHVQIRQRCRECGALRIVYSGEIEKAPAGNMPAVDLAPDAVEVDSLAFAPVVHPN